MTEEVVQAIDARAVALFPPRPDAYVTLLHSDDFLPGVQNLLYSLKKKLSITQSYPPEIVVLVTPNVSTKLCQDLVPHLCTRLLPVDEWLPPAHSIDEKLGKKAKWTRSIDNHSPGWTKLRIFSLQQYETIVYIDPDCLVLQDISSLMELNKVYVESESLVAAAPDLLPPSNFNSGVMVIRPSTETWETMRRQAKLLTTFDGSDTGFLNAYFSNWYTDFPPDARLPVGFNAQQAMWDMTANPMGDGAPSSSFWDVQIASDLYIVHYSNSIKPWHADNKATSLVTLWRSTYRKSQNYLARQLEASKPAPPSTRKPAPKPAPANPALSLHKAISKRFKELRSQGIPTRQAMEQAQEELQPKTTGSMDVGTQVAAMFGMASPRPF